MKKRTLAAGAVALATVGLGVAQTSSADAGGGRINFELQRSPGIAAAGCLPNAAARVKVKHDGAVERMTIDLPANANLYLRPVQFADSPVGRDGELARLVYRRYGRTDSRCRPRCRSRYYRLRQPRCALP